jgi:hypothetical protein
MSHPRAAPGQIKVKYGVREGDLFLCHGEGTAKADAALLIGAVTDRVLDCDITTRYRLECAGKIGPSVLQQLEARGYDVTTLEISIRKKESN